jgi:hypothetical protein
MTRYLLAVNYAERVARTPMTEWTPEEIKAHLDYHEALHKGLVGSGELVDSRF